MVRCFVKLVSGIAWLVAWPIILYIEKGHDQDESISVNLRDAVFFCGMQALWSWIIVTTFHNFFGAIS